MFRYKLTLEYDGTPFAGWQRQEEYTLTVQGALETAFAKLTGQPCHVQSAGRTDAGVHALGQVAHVDLAKEWACFTVMQAINFHVIPHPVSIIAVERVDGNFHARFSATKRFYRYRICRRSAPLTLDRERMLHCWRKLDIAAMQKAASYLEGRHDFSSFRASECQAKSAIITLENVLVFERGEELHIEVSARSFLHHMVRNIVGTLLLVGQHKIMPEDMPGILAAKARQAAGPTAPAHGLYFVAVEYGENGYCQPVYRHCEPR
jgi:tRNA pseudouridine38-40 synthase